MENKSASFPTIEETIKRYGKDQQYDSYKQNDELVDYDLIPQNDPIRAKISLILQNQQFSSIYESKALASFCAAAIGDALGCHTENTLYDRTRNFIQGFQSLEDGKYKIRQPLGQWTDDTSQSLCLADNILVNNFSELVPLDLRHRIFLWWQSGYNNSKKNDKQNSRFSLGMGSTTRDSLTHFIKTQSSFVEKTDTYNTQKHRNGSVMRLSAVPIAFQNNLEKALDFAYKQSYITHNSEEAAECCKLLTYVTIKALKSEKTDHENLKNILDSLATEYETKNQALSCVAKSLKEPSFEIYENSPDYNSDINDRNWNWKDPNFEYSQHRIKIRPSIIGLYCTDCVAMALHLLYFEKSLQSAMLRAVNFGGDADSLAGVIGMMGGAFYGFDKFILEQYAYVQKWDENKVAIRAYKLFHQQGLTS